MIIFIRLIDFLRLTHFIALENRFLSKQTARISLKKIMRKQSYFYQCCGCCQNQHWCYEAEMLVSMSFCGRVSDSLVQKCLLQNRSYAEPDDLHSQHLLSEPLIHQTREGIGRYRWLNWKSSSYKCQNDLLSCTGRISDDVGAGGYMEAADEQVCN